MSRYGEYCNELAPCFFEDERAGSKWEQSLPNEDERLRAIGQECPYRIESISEKSAIGILAPAKLEKPMNHMM
jgi:hypothetical protein